MRVLTRIVKVADYYVLDGRVFDSFLSARREMVEEMRRRRARQRETRTVVARANIAGA